MTCFTIGFFALECSLLVKFSHLLECAPEKESDEESTLAWMYLPRYVCPIKYLPLFRGSTVDNQYEVEVGR
jgi:hypothetical protein